MFYLGSAFCFAVCLFKSFIQILRNNQGQNRTILVYLSFFHFARNGIHDITFDKTILGQVLKAALTSLLMQVSCPPIQTLAVTCSTHNIHNKARMPEVMNTKFEETTDIDNILCKKTIIEYESVVWANLTMCLTQ